MEVLHNVLDTLSGYLATGQEPQVMESERLSALVMKMQVERLSGSSISIAGGSFVLSNMEEILESWDEEDCYILAKVKLKKYGQSNAWVKEKIIHRIIVKYPYFLTPKLKLWTLLKDILEAFPLTVICQKLRLVVFNLDLKKKCTDMSAIFVSQPKQLNLVPRISRLTVHWPTRELHF